MVSVPYAIMYRDTCKKCRLLSWVAVILSLGVLRRIPISSDQAQILYEAHPESRGKLLLVLDHHVITGSQVIWRFPTVLPFWLWRKVGW